MATLEPHYLLPDRPFASYQEYRTWAGVDALAKARGKSPERVLEEVQLSGLRGRGGAGFPTGSKWSTLKNHPCKTRHVVCNAAEGEPGTFKDRWLLRQNPYPLLEGMLIAAHVIETRALHIGIKASFQKEAQRLRGAIEELKRADVLAGCELRIVEGPEEYLFGEEKALLEVLSGNDPLPRDVDSPPYEVGLFPTVGSPNPALVQNVETYSHVPSILRQGGKSFRTIGTHDTPGTLLFTVSGDVRRPGVYERPAGITLRELFVEVAGGPPEGRTFKAALSGVSSAVIPADRFDTPADFASLNLLGCGLGSAGFVLYDDQACIPRVAQMAAHFLYVESCNQCSACKVGLRTASRALNALFDPRTCSPDDLPRARFGARSAPQGNRCYLPVEGSVLIPSLMSRFEKEFEEIVASPERVTRPVPLPKFVDYDPAAHRFFLDERQPRKRPDWTYEPAPSAAPQPPPARPPLRVPRPVSVPRDAKLTHVGVRISPELAKELTRRAEELGLPVDSLVDRALRQFLDRAT
jgi:NADH-quinone oxidoreductase subunit F